MKFFKRYARNYGALIGLGILLVVVLLAFAAPLLFPVSPWQSVGDPLLAPSEDPAFPFGTDMLGRDIAAGLAYGARVSLLIGMISTAAALIIGVTIGALAGFTRADGRSADALHRALPGGPGIHHVGRSCGDFNPVIVTITIGIAVVSWPPSRDSCAASS